MKKIIIVCLGLSVIGLASLSADSYTGYGAKKIKDSSNLSSTKFKLAYFPQNHHFEYNY